MIDVDKVKAAFATTSVFCQHSYYEAPKNGNPAALCAMTALCSYAGMHPDLIGKFVNTAGFSDFFESVVYAGYGIPDDVAMQIPGIFDGEENEWKGITAVIALCEEFNARPVPAPEPRTRGTWATYPMWSTHFTYAASDYVGGVEKVLKWVAFDVMPTTLTDIKPGDVMVEIGGILTAPPLIALPSTNLVADLVPPDRQIIEPARSIPALVTAQPLLLGNSLDWRVPSLVS